MSKESLINSAKNLYVKNRYAVIITVLAAIFFATNLVQYNNNATAKLKLAVAEQNLKAATDEIRVSKDKDGRPETNKLAFLVESMADLKNMNTALYNEIKSIKGQPSTVIQGEVKVVDRPVPFVVQGQLVDSTIRTDFKFDSTYSPGNYRKLAGYTTFNLKTGESNGVKTQDELGMKFTTGIKNLQSGKPEIFLKSDYPGFTVTELDGAVIDPNLFKKPKQKKLSIGFHAGYSPLYYNFSQKKFGLANQATAGFGLNYKL